MKSLGVFFLVIAHGFPECVFFPMHDYFEVGMGQVTFPLLIY